MLFSIDGTFSVCTCFPLCSSKRGFVKRVAFDKSLNGPGSSSSVSRKWLADLLVLMMEELLKRPMLWNLHIQLSFEKLLRILELLYLHAWGLSVILCTRQDFRWLLCRSSHQILGIPQHVLAAVPQIAKCFCICRGS